MKPIKLNKDERNQIADALDECKQRDSGESWRNGSHMILVHLLNLFGYSARSSEQAENMAEEILWGKE